MSSNLSPFSYQPKRNEVTRVVSPVPAPLASVRIGEKPLRPRKQDRYARKRIDGLMKRDWCDLCKKAFSPAGHFLIEM